MGMGRFLDRDGKKAAMHMIDLPASCSSYGGFEIVIIEIK